MINLSSAIIDYMRVQLDEWDLVLYVDQNSTWILDNRGVQVCDCYTAEGLAEYITLKKIHKGKLDICL